MAFYEMLPGGMPSGLQAGMDSVLNKKFGTSTTYPAEDWPDTVNLMGPLPEKTASGAIVTFNDGADEVPIKAWEVEIAPTLTGKSAIEATQSGKNLMEAPTYSASTDSLCLDLGKDMTFTNLTLSFLATNSEVDTITSAIVDYRKSDNTHQYKTLNDFTDINNVRFSANSANNGVFKNTVTNITFRYVYISYTSVSRSKFTSDSLSNWQLENNNTVTNYEPYTAPTTHTADLGRTIYGGTAGIVKGQGSGEWATVKLKNLTWYYSTAYGGFFRSPSIQSVVSDETYICVSSEYTNVRLNSYKLQNTDNAIGINVDNGSAVTGAAPLKSIVVKDTDYTTVADLIAHFTANDSTLCYKLATPETFTFSPITPTPETALGTNNFWADEGDSKVTYRADINLALGGN